MCLVFQLLSCTFCGCFWHKEGVDPGENGKKIFEVW